MATYTAIQNSEVDPESPITSSLMLRLRDNPLAIAEGSPDAPRVQPGAPADFPGAVGSDNTGWIRLPGGLLIQWGETETKNSSSSPRIVTFPVAFTAPPGNIQVTSHRTRVWSYGNETYAHSETKTQFTCEVSGHDGHPQTRKVFWMAIGL